MKEEFLGKVVKTVRVKKGYTQKELSKGICSISTLSRIENGTHAPSRAVFTMLFEKMGESASIYDDYMGEYDFEIYNLFRNYMYCMERFDIVAKESVLLNIREYVDNNNLNEKENKIYRYIEIIDAYFEHILTTKDNYLEQKQYGMFLVDEINKYFCGLEDNIKLVDRVDFRVMNTLATANYMIENHQKAVEIWSVLISDIRDNELAVPERSKELAIIYNNIATGLVELGFFEEAKMFSEKAISYSFDVGGLCLLYKLIWTRCYIYAKKGEYNKACSDLSLAKLLYYNSKFKKITGICLDNIPNKPYIVQFF